MNSEYLRIKKALFEAKKYALGKKRTCMFERCQNPPINSHVLQKNGILREISRENHLIENQAGNPFKMDAEGTAVFRAVGINDVYTFPGFCQEHDNEIFKQIEKESEIDFFGKLEQALFSYRGLCQEIYRKETSIDMMKHLISNVEDEQIRHYYTVSLDGAQFGLENLIYFKKEFEVCLQDNDCGNYYFRTLKIPKIELCISVPLNIKIPENEIYSSYQEWQKLREIPFTTSFFNIFPYKETSYIIAGYHKEYPCSWTENFLKRIEYGTCRGIKKELSDLVVLRLEFWAMSHNLYESIDQKEIERFRNTFSENILSHSPELRTDINLFRNI